MKSYLRRYSEYFLIGVLAVLPILIVIQIVLWLKNIGTAIFFGIHGYSESYMVTFVLFFLIIILLSYIGYSIAKRRRSIIITAFDLLIGKIPLLNTIYRVSQKIMNMFRGDGELVKREVVYVEYPNDGLWVPAYVTNKEKDWYILYVPTSPNPTSGFTIIVNEARVIKSELTIEEASSFVVSIGFDYPKPEEATKFPR
jgi:uncharacterized membrane protein